jgi:hypothetical protein
MRFSGEGARPMKVVFIQVRLILLMLALIGVVSACKGEEEAGSTLNPVTPSVLPAIEDTGGSQAPAKNKKIKIGFSMDT